MLHPVVKAVEQHTCMPAVFEVLESLRLLREDEDAADNHHPHHHMHG